MNRTTKTTATQPEAVQRHVSTQEFAHLLGEVAAQYDAARAAILMLSLETTRMATKCSAVSATKRDGVGSNASELMTIMNDVAATLTAALIPVAQAKATIDLLSTSTALDHRHENETRQRIGFACASAAHSLDAALPKKISA